MPANTHRLIEMASALERSSKISVNVRGDDPDNLRTAAAELTALRKALRDMLAHLFGPNDTGMTRPQIEAQARAALE